MCKLVTLITITIPSYSIDENFDLCNNRLFCWDLDGTLVYRQGGSDPSPRYTQQSSTTTTPNPTITKGGGVTIADGTTPYKLCTLKGQAKVYLRSHARQLLKWLALDEINNNAPLAFYTSMTSPNAYPLCKQLMSQVCHHYIVNTDAFC
jgi:hypothetical protein